MKIKDGFVLRNICDEYIVVAVGRQTLDFKGLIKLNETGAFLWEQLKNDCSESELLAALRAEYAVDEATAQADITAFLASLKEAALLA
ncbi:MAG: PqqD family protein [Clostridia bacterium]|nr:PqqD family protein [Clostridia bacterium]